jgi:hypothetical protein
MSGNDILFAMRSLAFENYGEALEIYLTKYREVRCFPFFSYLHVLSFSATLRASDNKVNLFKTQSAREERQQRPDSEYRLAGGQSGAGSGSADGGPDTMMYNLQA